MRIEQEGPNVRVTTARNRGYVLLDSDREQMGEAIERCAAMVHDTFEPRWLLVAESGLDRAEFELMVEEIVLNWVHFYTANHLPVEITEEDLNHPQSCRIVQWNVEGRYSEGSEEWLELCAQLTGLSRKEFVEWRQGERMFQDR